MRDGSNVGPEGQRRELEPYVTTIVMNLWECDLLWQWNTEINITPILETNHKLTDVPRKKITRY